MKESVTEEPANFDNMNESGQQAIAQLTVIKACLENFGRLSSALKDRENIKQGMQQRRMDG
jgi:hypothetical protein